VRIIGHKFLLSLLDTIAVIFGFGFSFWFVFDSGHWGAPRPVPGYCFPTVLVAVLLLLASFRLQGLYNYETVLNPIHQIEKLARCFLRVFAVFAMVAFFMRAPYIADSRFTVGLGFAVSFGLSLILRVLAVPRALAFVASRRLIEKRTLILGAGAKGRSLATHFRLDPYHYFDVVGFLDDDPALANQIVEGIPVLGTTHEVDQVASRLGCVKAMIGIDRIGRSELLDIINRCRDAGLVVHVVSDLSSNVSEKLECEQYNGVTTFRLESADGSQPALRWAKRAVDLAGASALLVLLAPVFAFIAWKIKRDSEGAVFYRCREVGLNEHIFQAYKFRTMIAANASDPEARRQYEAGRLKHLEFMRDFIQGRATEEFFVKGENRVTRVGRVLRKYSLDELPQLINVFRGEMSLVGPRFCSEDEFQFYLPWQKKRLLVKPGMTGLWQVRARSEVSYADMVMIDLYYIHNWSLLFDLEILLRTIPVVLHGKGSRIK